MNFKFPKKLCALVLVLMCLWAIPALAQEAPGPTESAFVLPKLLVPAAGFQGAFVITEQSVQEVGELASFLLVDAFEGSYEERAIRVHYTVLSEDPEEGSAQVRVRAQPLDPRTRGLLGPAQWEGIYELTEYGVLWEWESDIPPAYADLVQPAWLVEWSATPYELPEGAIEPGTAWEAPLPVRALRSRRRRSGSSDDGSLCRVGGDSRRCRPRRTCRRELTSLRRPCNRRSFKASLPISRSFLSSMRNTG